MNGHERSMEAWRARRMYAGIIGVYQGEKWRHIVKWFLGI